MAYSVVEPPMKRRFFAGPPKVTLETRCGTNIRPSNSPPALMQWTPSAALLQMLPCSSTRIPSQYPGSILWKMSPPDSVAPSGSTLARRLFGLVSGFGYVQSSFVGRKREPIGTIEIVRDDSYVARFRFEPVDRRRLFRRLPSAFIVVRDAIEWIGEPDRTV